MLRLAEIEMSSREAGEIARLQVTDVNQTFPTEAGCSDWIPDPRGYGVPRIWNGCQVMLLAIHADLVRFGMPIPRAGKVVGRIAETLAFNPDAEKLFIEFRTNGASFFTVGGEPNDAAHAAGKVRFTMTLELATYRRAVEAAAGVLADA